MTRADVSRQEPTADGHRPADRPHGFGSRARMKGLLSTLPLMMSCDRFERFVPDYLESNLRRTLRRRFDLHRRPCVECSAHLDRSSRSLRDRAAREWLRRDAARD